MARAILSGWMVGFELVGEVFEEFMVELREELLELVLLLEPGKSLMLVA